MFLSLLIFDHLYQYFSFLFLGFFLRNKNINSEIYPGNNFKLSKQFQYCDKNLSPVAVIIGQEEIEKNLIKFKVIQGEKDKNEFTTTKEKLVNEIQKFI